MFFLIFIFSMLVIIFWQNNHKDIEKRPPNLGAAGYTLIYTDQKGDFDRQKIIVSEMLVSKRYDIRGKPDYVYMNRRTNDLLPIELKSGKIGDKEFPHQGDFMQLIAYFVMLEDVFGIQPKEGRVIYKDHMFIIKNTKEYREELFKILSDMRDMLKTGDNKANASFVTCRHCICNGTVCEFCKSKYS